MKTIGFLFFFLLLCSCNSRENDKHDIVELFVDDNYTPKELSEIIDSIKIIPLETTDNSLIGFLSELKYDDGYFFVQDGYNRLVSVFDDNGSFLRQLTRKGNGPGEVRYPESFSLDKIHKEVWISNNNNFMRFDYQGKYLGHRNYSLSFSDFYVDTDYDIYFYTSKSDNAHIQDGFLTGDLTLLTTDDKKQTWFKSDLVGHYRPNISKTYYVANHPFSLQKDGSATFSYVFNDTIYSIKDNLIIPKYCIHLTGNSISSKKLNNMPGEAVKEYVNNHSKLQWNMNGVYETPSYLLFSYMIGLDNCCWCIYNKKTKSLSNLKIIDDLFGLNWIDIKETVDDKIIAWISTDELKISNKLISFVGQKEFEKLQMITHNDNPIIIEFTLKDEL